MFIWVHVKQRREVRTIPTTWSASSCYHRKSPLTNYDHLEDRTAEPVDLVVLAILGALRLGSRILGEGGDRGRVRHGARSDEEGWGREIK